jgi:putative ABC transport system permease protein
MVALPVVGLAAVDVVARTSSADQGSNPGALSLPAGVDAQVLWFGGGRVEQSPDASSVSIAGERPDAPPPDDRTVARVTGAREVLATNDGALRLLRSDGRSRQVQVVEADLGSPLAPAVLGVLTDGRLPQGPDEVVVTRAVLRDTGVALGGALLVAGTERQLVVVGTLRRPGEPAGEPVEATVVGLPGLRPADGTVEGSSWSLRTTQPLLWPDVVRLNEQGFVVRSRAVAEDPPPDSEVPLLRNKAAPTLDAAAFVVLAAGMGLLEVVLLAGPAFAVGARRSKRVLALLAATGGDRRQVRDVVLAQGLVLGLLGAAVGVTLGIGLGLVALPLLERLDDTIFPDPVIRPMELLALGGVGVVTAVLAALLPARGVSRQDVSLALAGRREPVRTRARVPVLGVALTAAGFAGVLAGVDQRSAVGILAGAALGQVGLVLCTPTLVRLVGRTGRFLPLTPRLAVRDAARNVGRTAPAVAAVMAAVAGVVASSIFAASLSERDARSYTPRLPSGQVQVELADRATPADLDAVEQAVRGVIPVERLVAVRTTDGSACRSACTTAVPLPPEDRQCPLAALRRNPTEAERAAADRDARCTGVPFARGYQGVLVDDGSGLEVLLGRPDPAAAQVLRDGGALAVDPALVEDGELRLQLTGRRPSGRRRRRGAGAAGGTRPSPLRRGGGGTRSCGPAVVRQRLRRRRARSAGRLPPRPDRPGRRRCAGHRGRRRHLDCAGHDRRTARPGHDGRGRRLPLGAPADGAGDGTAAGPARDGGRRRRRGRAGDRRDPRAPGRRRPHFARRRLAAGRPLDDAAGHRAAGPPCGRSAGRAVHEVAAAGGPPEGRVTPRRAAALRRARLLLELRTRAAERGRPSPVRGVAASGAARPDAVGRPPGG